MARLSQTGAVPGAQATATVPQTGAIPPRPANFKYTSNLSGVTDANQLSWSSNTTDEVEKWELYYSNTPDNAESARTHADWTLVDTITNSASANTYTPADQISDRWYVLVPLNTFGNVGPIAGPIENRRPERTVTVKGYYVDLNGDPLPDAQITVELSVSSSITSVTLTGHQRVNIAPQTITPENDTGFWEVKLLSSNEFTDLGGISGTPGYKFVFRAEGRVTETSAKVAPDGSSEDVWLDDLSDAA